MATLDKKYLKYVFMLTAITLVFSCSSDNTIEMRKQELLKGDESLLPKTMSFVDATALDLNKIKSDLYSEGCQSVGSAQADLKLHPKLKADASYRAKNTQIQGSQKFSMSYIYYLEQLPTVSSDILLSGQLLEAELAGYEREALNVSGTAVEKKCSLTSSPSVAEHCEDLAVDYSQEFIETLAKVFKEDVNCQFGASDIPAKEKWQEGRYVMDNSKPIKVYIHSVQTVLNRICAGEKQARRVVKTVVKATSNHIVSPYRSHCGGEIVYDKVIYRDHISNEIIWSEAYELTLAPIATVGE
jgi:hypothetical protein